MNKKIDELSPNYDKEIIKKYEKVLGRCLGTDVEFPSWHPLVRLIEDYDHPNAHLSNIDPEKKFAKLDHTVYFENGFLTAPYHSFEELIESFQKAAFNAHWYYDLYITDISIYDHFYSQKSTKCFMVEIDWNKHFFEGKSINKYFLWDEIVKADLAEAQLHSADGGSSEPFIALRKYLVGLDYDDKPLLSYVDKKTINYIKKQWDRYYDMAEWKKYYDNNGKFLYTD